MCNNIIYVQVAKTFSALTIFSVIKLQENKQPFRYYAYDFSYELEICAKQFFHGEQRPKGTQIKRDGWLQKQMRGVESAEAENAGGKRERELYPPPLLVVQNREMRQRGVRDREKGREREMGTDKGSKQRNIHMRNRQRKSSNGLNHPFTDLKLPNLPGT